MNSEDYKRGVKCVRVGGGIAIRYDDDLLEISTDALYAIEAIAIERQRLLARVADLDLADAAIRRVYGQVFS